MATMRLTIFLALVASLGMPGECHDWPSLVFKENEIISIPCLIEGDSAAYLWKQGDSYDTSEHFAANFDVEGGNDDRVTVLDNGTLVIYNMSSEFVARYHCRVVTENTEYHASVSVQMDAWQDDSLLSIDKCQLSPCSIALHPNETQHVICIATGVTSDLSLRWRVNQSSTIPCTTDVLEHDDGSSDLSCTVEVSYEMAVLSSVLSCEAYRDNVVSRYVFVDLESRIEDTERTDQQDAESSYLIGFVLLAIICGILMILVAALLVVLWRNRQSRRAKKGLEAGDENQELIRKDGGEFEREIKELQKQLEQQKRKYRSKELESKERMRAILRFVSAGEEEKVVKPEKLEHLINKYGLSEVFQTNQSDDEVFKSIEDVVQSAVDGNAVCCVYLEAQGSRTATDYRGNISFDGNFLFVGAIMGRIFSCKEDLCKRGLELKVIASYLTECGGTKTQYRYGCLDASAPGTGKMLVKGLNVETKMYELSRAAEVIDLVKSVGIDGKEEEATPSLGGLQLYLETWMDGSQISKGSLALPFFYNEVSTKAFLGMSGTVGASLRELISDRSAVIAVVATLTQDTSEENTRILQFLEEVKNMNRKDAGDVESTSG